MMTGKTAADSGSAHRPRCGGRGDLVPLRSRVDVRDQNVIEIGGLIHPAIGAAHVKMTKTRAVTPRGGERSREDRHGKTANGNQTKCERTSFKLSWKHREPMIEQNLRTIVPRPLLKG